MALPRDPERVRQILSDTIGLLCRNGFSFEVELSVDALIGITIDRHEVLLVSIKDTFTDSRRKSISLDYFDSPHSFTNSSETEENHSSERVSAKNSARKRSHSSNVDHLRNSKKLLVIDRPPAEGSCPKSAESCRKKVAAGEDSGRIAKNAFNEAETKTFESEYVHPKSEISNAVCVVGNSRTLSASELSVIGCAKETLYQNSSDQLIEFTDQRQHSQLSESDCEGSWRVFSFQEQSILNTPDTVSCLQNNSLETLPCIGALDVAVVKQSDCCQQRDKEEHLQISLNLRDRSTNSIDSEASNCLTSEDKPTGSHQAKHTTHKQRRNSMAFLYSQEKSSDGGIVYVKEEVMSSADETDRSGRPGGHFSALQTIGNLREAVLAAAPVADYHLESFAFHPLNQWKDSVQDSFISGVRGELAEWDCGHLMLSDFQVMFCCCTLDR